MLASFFKEEMAVFIALINHYILHTARTLNDSGYIYLRMVMQAYTLISRYKRQIAIKQKIIYLISAIN